MTWTTRTQRPDFSEKPSNNDVWYDLYDDWSLVEASIAKQYGIRIRQNKDMPWSEFCNLVSGLTPDTPLGQIVSIRAEKDAKTLKSFTPEQKKIRSEWMRKQAAKQLETPEKLEKQMADLSRVFAQLFGKGGSK